MLWDWQSGVLLRLHFLLEWGREQPSQKVVLRNEGSLVWEGALEKSVVFKDQVATLLLLPLWLLLLPY